MFSVGDKVTSKRTHREGEIVEIRSGKVPMYRVMVETEAGLRTKWIPPEMVYRSGRLSVPASEPLTPWKRTTPKHIVTLRRRLWAEKRLRDRERAS